MNKKKIILLTLSDLVEEANLHRKAVTLIEQGYQVEIFAAYHPGLDVSLWSGVTLVRRRFHRSPMLLRLIEFMAAALFYLMRRQADLFISYDVYALVSLRIKQLLQGCKYVYDSVELFVEIQALQGKPLRRWLWKLYERAGIRGARTAFTVCRSDAEALKRKYSFLPPVPFVRNIPLYRPAKSSDFLREKYGVPKNAKIGIYQGKIFKGRGLRQLIRAVPGLNGFALFIVGDGPLKPELKALAAELNVKTQVYFIDAVPFQELTAYTAGADFGFTIISGKGLSYYHALPNKLFEYIQAGLPVIGSNYPEIKAVIEGDQIGYTVEPDDVPAIRRAIQQMLVQENYDAFRRRLQKIRQKYTWEEESKKYAAIIRSALE